MDRGAWRGLEGYNPYGHKESDTTERPNVKVKSLSRVQLFCDPMDRSLPVSSIHGILQARILEWVAISFSRKDLTCKQKLKFCLALASWLDFISLFSLGPDPVQPNVDEQRKSAPWSRQ